MFLEKMNIKFLAFSSHVIRPDTCLDFTDMSLVQKNHTESALSDTAADTQRKFVVEKFLMEIKLSAFLFSFNSELFEQRSLIYADPH